MKKYILITFLVTICNVVYSQYIIDLVKVEDVESIKAFSGDINVKDKNGATVLMWAAFYSDIEMVKLLVSKGADVSAKGIINKSDKNATYGSCMAVAAGKNKADIVEYFVRKLKIPLDDREISPEGEEIGWNALFWASYNGSNDVLRYLKKKKVDFNQVSKTDRDESPLHFAVRENHLETVKLLVELGVDPNMHSSYGSTALDLALTYGRNNANDIVLYLMSIDAKSSKTKEQINKYLSKSH